jgi:hypothetical protein
MTEYLWDQSHYDGVITLATMQRAKAEGIVGVVHKVGEGTGGDDPQDRTALAAARDAGIGFVGGYHVTRSVDVTAQVDAVIALADRDEGWWRSFPGWFWMEDLERWPYDPVPASVGIACAKQLRERTGRQVFLYASHGQYGDALKAWDGPLWNADYTGSPAAGFRALYPGDLWAPLHGSWHGGWAPYSDRTPTFLQYTSSATVAGLTTCDANAFRGSLDELRHLIQGDTMPTAQEITAAVWGSKLYKDYVDVDGDGTRPLVSAADALFKTRADAYAANAKADALLAAVKALSTGNADVAAILAGVDERLANLRTAVRTDVRDAVADEAEGGAAAVRSDA